MTPERHGNSGNNPKSNAQKQAEHRTRLSHGGLFRRRDFYCHPDDEPTLRALETALRKYRLESSGSTPAEAQPAQIQG